MCHDSRRNRSCALKHGAALCDTSVVSSFDTAIPCLFDNIQNLALHVSVWTMASEICLTHVTSILTSWLRCSANFFLMSKNIHLERRLDVPMEY